MTWQKATLADIVAAAENASEQMRAIIKTVCRKI